MSDFLFAYGTLQVALAPAEIASVVAGFRSFGEAYLAGTLYDFGRFPGLVLDGSAPGRVYGTLYALPSIPGILDALDAYEDFDPADPEHSQFVRCLCPVTLVDGGTVRSWVYAYHGATESATVIADGRYRGRI